MESLYFDLCQKRNFSPLFKSPFIYLFSVLRHALYLISYIVTGSWKGRGNQYIQLVNVLYCKLPNSGKEFPGPGFTKILKLMLKLRHIISVFVSREIMLKLVF